MIVNGRQGFDRVWVRWVCANLHDRQGGESPDEAGAAPALAVAGLGSEVVEHTGGVACKGEAELSRGW